MKQFIFISALLLTSIFSSCSYIPGTEQSRIRNNVSEYIKKNLLINGEEMQLGNIELKAPTNFDNKKCVFTEATYLIQSKNGTKQEKKLYLLISNDYRTIVLSSEVPEVDWNPCYIKVETSSNDEYSKCIQKIIQTERL